MISRPNPDVGQIWSWNGPVCNGQEIYLVTRIDESNMVHGSMLYSWYNNMLAGTEYCIGHIYNANCLK